MADRDDKRKGARAKVARLVTRVPFLRRLYIKRLLRYLDKAEAKHRNLPPELSQLATRLRRVPKKSRSQVLEEALMAEQKSQHSRDLRRQVARQQRQSGRGQGRQRPGGARPPRGAVPRKPR